MCFNSENLNYVFGKIDYYVYMWYNITKIYRGSASIKNHVWRDGTLIQTNKKLSALKQSE